MRDATCAIDGRPANRGAEGGWTCAAVACVPFGRFGDGAAAVAARRTSGAALASASRGDGASAASRAGCDDVIGVLATARAEWCRAGVMAVAGSAPAFRTRPVNSVACSGTAPAICMTGERATSGNGSWATISPPMIASAPMLQQAACRARRSCARSTARAMCRCRPAAPAATAGTPADDGCSADSGCQRQVRCGASTSMHEVVNVATQRMSERLPDAAPNRHSRPNGGTPSSGATRGRAIEPSTETRGDGIMRAVRGATRAAWPAAARSASQIVTLWSGDRDRSIGSI